MKRIVSFFIVVLLTFSLISGVSCAVEQSFVGTTSAQTPIVIAKLKFSKKFGANYRAAPTPPTVVGDTLLLVSGVKLYKLNAQTGDEIASVKLQSTTLYATVAPIYADGKVFVQLDGGIVQAFDYQSLKSLWIYEDPLGGQAICPITYSSGYIYTGFWNDEDEDANYICLSVDDEDINNEYESKNASWTYRSQGGFYWAGCAVSDKFVVFGKDDGQKGSDSQSSIVVVDKSNGEEVSAIETEGDIRSSVTFYSENDSYYVSSKAGYVYKFTMDSETGVLSSLKAYKAEGAVTATPVVYNNRLYIGYQSEKSGKFAVLDANTMKEIYSCEMLGYPQNTMLVSIGYEAMTSKVYIYSTYNNRPGGITVFEDSEGQTKPQKTELFKPDDSQSQYCISTVSVGADGTLYYKNDSGYIFAVTSDVTENGFVERIIAFINRIIEKIKSLFR